MTNILKVVLKLAFCGFLIILAQPGRGADATPGEAGFARLETLLTKIRAEHDQFESEVVPWQDGFVGRETLQQQIRQAQLDLHKWLNGQLAKDPKVAEVKAKMRALREALRSENADLPAISAQYERLAPQLTAARQRLADWHNQIYRQKNLAIQKLIASYYRQVLAAFRQNAAKLKPEVKQQKSYRDALQTVERFEKYLAELDKLLADLAKLD